MISSLQALYGWTQEQASSGGEGPFNLSLSLAELQALNADIASYFVTDRPGSQVDSADVATAPVGDVQASDAPTIGQSRDWFFAAGETLCAMGRQMQSREVSLAGTNAEQAGLWLDRAIALGAGS